MPPKVIPKMTEKTRLPLQRNRKYMLSPQELQDLLSWFDTLDTKTFNALRSTFDALFAKDDATKAAAIDALKQQAEHIEKLKAAVSLADTEQLAEIRKKLGLGK